MTSLSDIKQSEIIEAFGESLSKFMISITLLEKFCS